MGLDKPENPKYVVVAEDSDKAFRRELGKWQKLGYSIHSIATGVSGQYVALLHRKGKGDDIESKNIKVQLLRGNAGRGKIGKTRPEKT